MSEKILLIDDDDRLVGALRMRLQSLGYEVHTAHDGEMGLSQAALFRPDAMILDIRMPELDGFEVCRHIRAIPDLCAIPIIILSASMEDITARMILEAGGNIFVN